jgi:hypothetical protein
LEALVDPDPVTGFAVVQAMREEAERVRTAIAYLNDDISSQAMAAPAPSGD